MAFDFRREMDRAQENIRGNPKLLIGIGVFGVFLILLIVLNMFVFGRSSQTLSADEVSKAQKLAEEAAKAQADYERDNPAPVPPPIAERGAAKPK